MNDHIPEHRAGDAHEEEEPLVGDAPPQDNTIFSNAVYDKLKFVSLVVLPALGAFYFGLAQLLGLPYGLEVVGVIALVDTFLGTVLGISTKQYNNSDARFDGAIVVTPNEDGNSDLNLRLDRSAVARKKEITVRVKRV